MVALESELAGVTVNSMLCSAGLENPLDLPCGFLSALSWLSAFHPLPRRLLWRDRFAGRRRGEMLAHLGRKLTLRHLVGSCHFDGNATQCLALNALTELGFGFTWTKNEK